MKNVKTSPGVFPVKWAILVTIVFGAVQLPFSSFMADDFMQLGILEGVSPCTWLGPMDIYTLADGDPVHMRTLKDSGAFQWFWSPQFKAKFFRPLSSLLLLLDHAIFGLNPIGYSLHNILWFASLIIAAGFLMQRAVPGRISTMAVVIFSISGIHWYVVYWTAARHIIVAASIGLWSLLAYTKWREQGWKKGRFISILGILFSLLAGEAALGVLAYFFAYELLATDDALKQKLKNLLPFILMTIAYLIVYKSLGYGASAGSGYLSPLTVPLRFLLAFPGRFLALAGSMIVGGHTELWMFPSIRLYIILIAVLIIILFTILFKKVSSLKCNGTGPLAYRVPSPRGAQHIGSSRRGARWMLVGSVISLIPFSVASPGARCLVVPFVGGAVIISFVLYYWWKSVRKLPGLKLRILSIFCWLLLFIHFVFAPIQRFVGPGFAREVFVNRLKSVLEKAEFNHKQLPQKIVLLTVPDFSIGLHSYYYRKLNRDPLPESWWVLSWESCDHRVYRSDSNTFELELINGSINRSFLKQGTVIKLTGMVVTVLKAGKEGAKCIEFRFDRSLNDSSLKFLAWIDEGLKSIQMPPVGQSIFLPAKK
ncbi:MAG: hypothetical protein JSV88_13225 [Candidatus Aminicenantes bacterium]|nr:MAG: hypothetical protein JSV88_13225 [Candidatus Aminicenantes bacterium]